MQPSTECLLSLLPCKLDALQLWFSHSHELGKELYSHFMAGGLEGSRWVASFQHRVNYIGKKSVGSRILNSLNNSLLLVQEEFCMAYFSGTYIQGTCERILDPDETLNLDQVKCSDTAPLQSASQSTLLWRSSLLWVGFFLLLVACGIFPIDLLRSTDSWVLETGEREPLWVGVSLRGRRTPQD